VFPLECEAKFLTHIKQRVLGYFLNSIREDRVTVSLCPCVCSP
jgi:hypothetical protein